MSVNSESLPHDFSFFHLENYSAQSAKQKEQLALISSVGFATAIGKNHAEMKLLKLVCFRIHADIFPFIRLAYTIKRVASLGRCLYGYSGTQTHIYDLQHCLFVGL